MTDTTTDTYGVRLAKELCERTIDNVIGRTGLTEQLSDDGGPFFTIKSAFDGQPTGIGRIWTGEGKVRKAVYYGLWNDQIGLDSHMLFAFADPDSPIPHFTLDSVMNRPDFAFHLDLIPRVDLGSHLAYMDAVYGPISAANAEGAALPGLAKAHLSPRQLSIMSAWMLAYRATEDAYPTIEPYVLRYLDQWYSLLDNGLPGEVLDSIKDADFAARDRANRSIIFNRDVDPVWNQVTPLIGDEQSELMRLNLANNEIIREIG